MNEVKSPKKPLIYYYLAAILLVVLFNMLAMPWLAEHQIQEVDYNTFVSMTEKNEIGKVEIQQQSNRILFTDRHKPTKGTIIYHLHDRIAPVLFSGAQIELLIRSFKHLAGYDPLMVVMLLNLLPFSSVFYRLVVLEVWSEGLSCQHISTVALISQDL